MNASLAEGSLDVSGGEGLYIGICDDLDKIGLVDFFASVPQ